MARRLGLFCIPVALLGLSLLPAAASAETHTFLNATDLFATLGAGTYGPSSPYPSSIAVSGLSGTVTKAKVTIIGYRSTSPQDTDIVITGPNGQKALLMSDACGTGTSNALQNENWTFDDSAATYLPLNGPCSSYQNTSYLPSGYFASPSEPTENPDMSIYPGGPPPPYVNALSFFNGASPNGVWNLYVLDDYPTCCVGFDIAGWALTLEVQPPQTASPGSTGERAAALKKCKKKQRKARKRCIKKAKKLPV